MKTRERYSLKMLIKEKQNTIHLLYQIDHTVYDLATLFTQPSRTKIRKPLGKMNMKKENPKKTP